MKKLKTRNELLREISTATRDRVVEAINDIERDNPDAFVMVWRKGNRMEYRIGAGISISEMVGMVERSKFMFLHDEEHPV